ncbi:hypothetical protein PGT21_013178 [Puccinia graminis f. sp. tritici]|uniref:Uncharacterized protein n=1 Tax=Puccinia graminis f. sp. tritici TaxID=56615 RepID=A0A5B0SL02_PUCGR|nr:hypothetical protein PGT21_013178 [Puccinia graminis f. sp. tritici]KAA1138608.1 hypothetical protein PGTUg99_030989 [Puccinia graminis f. sp. tritici]
MFMSGGKPVTGPLETAQWRTTNSAKTARILSEDSYCNLQKLQILDSGELGTLVLVVVANRLPGSSPRNCTDFWKLWILDSGELGTIIFFVLVLVVVANRLLGSSPRNHTDFRKLWIDSGELGTD